MRCVCDTWGQDVDNCLVEVPDPDDGDGSGAQTGYQLIAAVVSACVALSLF